jgi:large subunit ribosomal protein L18
MSNVYKRAVRHSRIRRKIFGTAQRPRLSVHFSGRHITAQVINDTEGRTIASVNTTEKDLRVTAKANSTGAKTVGKLIAERGLAKGIRLVVFDRGGFQYHGKVRVLADAARGGGFQF